MSPSTRPPRAGQPRRRVSRGTLSRQQIVDATLGLVRDDPDANITMERVASVLGTRPMSLYTHVRNRDELVRLAAAQALGEWDAAVPADAPWDEQLGAWCRSLRDHVRAYPSLLLEMTSQGAFQPALVGKVAVLARILRRAGVDNGDAGHVREGLACVLTKQQRAVVRARQVRQHDAIARQDAQRRSDHVLHVRA